MIKPFFAKNKALERTLSHAENAGVQILHVSSPGNFAQGDRIFCAEADGSELEYLGLVETVGADHIEVSCALTAAKSATATVWKAASVFQWETVASSPVRRAFHEGIAVERAAGGALWSVRTADPWREDALRFPGISRGYFTAFRAWLTARARGGLDDFTWVDEARAIARARLLECDFVQEENAPKTTGLILRLAVLEEGDYV